MKKTYGYRRPDNRKKTSAPTAAEPIRTVLFALLCAALFLIERSFLQNVSPLRISITFAAGLLSYAALSRGSMTAGILGIVYGLLADAASPARLCIRALAYFLIGWLGGMLCARLMRRNFGGYCLCALALSACCGVVTFARIVSGWGTFPVLRGCLYALLCAVGSAVLALPVYPLGKLTLGSVHRSKERDKTDEAMENEPLL